jgi:hypothetical protein
VSGGDDLVNRLRTLKSAFGAELVTRAEYDAVRAKALET